MQYELLYVITLYLLLRTVHTKFLLILNIAIMHHGGIWDIKVGVGDLLSR